MDRAELLPLSTTRALLSIHHLNILKAIENIFKISCKHNTWNKKDNNFSGKHGKKGIL